MKNKVIYVDFANKTILPNPTESLSNKNWGLSLWDKFKKLFSLNNHEESPKTKSPAYTYKHTL